PLLPAERGERARAATARPQGRRAAPDRALPAQVRLQIQARRDGVLAGRDPPPARVRLSRERARAGEPGAPAGGPARRATRARRAAGEAGGQAGAATDVAGAPRRRRAAGGEPGASAARRPAPAPPRP